jgi:putative ABC transport system permease protein
VARETADKNANQLLVSLATAASLSPGASRYGERAAVLLPTPSGASLPDSADVAEARAAFEADGWTVQQPRLSADTQAADLFGFMLRAAALLGLLLGGLGVANTMQVILAKRTREVAVLKTLGYRARHLLALFGVEAALLGLLGGALGSALGLALGAFVAGLLGQNLAILVSFTPTLGLALSGVAVGVGTAVIFGLVAIVRTSAVRPGLLLRQLPAKRTAKTHAATAGLYVLLFALFAALGALILGGVLMSLGVIAVGLVGLVVLGGLLVAFLLGFVRLPLPGGPLLKMARRTLQRRPLRAAYALVALFAGVVAIGIAAASLLNVGAQAEARDGGMGGYNVWVTAPLSEEADLRRTLGAYATPEAPVRYGTVVQADVRTADGTTDARLSTLEGRSLDDLWWDASRVDSLSAPFDADAWGRGDALVYVPAWMRERGPRLVLGDTLRAETSASMGFGTDLTVAGFFEPRDDVERIRPQRTILVPEAIARQIGGETPALHATVAVAESRLGAVTEKLGEALPAAFVIDRGSLNAFIDGLFRGLFWFAFTIASLALVAGAVLIANAVGLALVERQREIGVLKAIGYTRRDVLTTVLLENALLGLVAGVAGWLAVEGIVAVLNLRFDALGLGLNAWQALGLVGASVALALGSAALVAWSPTRRRPLAVLRQSE